jgi:hypothetical protein
MDSPLLVFLDDLQWADSGTVAALRTLPPRLISLPIGWVLATRPDRGPGQLRGVVEYPAGEGADRLVLEPLSQAAVAQVASEVMQAEPDESLLLMADEAGGNPFLLVNCSRACAKKDLSESTPDVRPSPRTGFPTDSARACKSAWRACLIQRVSSRPQPDRSGERSPSPIWQPCSAFSRFRC